MTSTVHHLVVRVYLPAKKVHMCENIHIQKLPNISKCVNNKICLCIIRPTGAKMGVHYAQHRRGKKPMADGRETEGWLSFPQGIVSFGITIVCVCHSLDFVQ